jgi:outer membrane receptor protein involved in Fe transport
MKASFSLRSVRACALVFAIASTWYAPASAQPSTTGTVTGQVQSGDGTPVVSAVVTLRGADGEHSAATHGGGQFSLPGLSPGSYAIRVAAPGFDTLTNRVIGVAAGTQSVTLTLARSSSSLVTIGRVQVAGGDALSTSSVPTTTIDTQSYAAQGYTRVSDVLQNDISTTLVHPLAGSSLLPTSVALRGPDPTETLVDIDGHQVNNGNTGDFDLSLLDPADFGSIELVKGISPSSLVGPDTIDGAINIRTLDPTALPAGALRLSVGSFSSLAETLESTGTAGRLGYAVSLHRTTSAGETNEPIFDVNSGALAQVGSSDVGSTALAKLRYAFGSTGDGYAEFSFHDQSQVRDLSAALTSVPSANGEEDDDVAIRHRLDTDTDPNPNGYLSLDGAEGTALASHNAGYGLDVHVPLGAPGASGVAATRLLFRHYSSLVSESVTGPGDDTFFVSPYLFSNTDQIDDETLELDHAFSNSSLTLQYGVRNETLSTDYVPGVLNEQSIARRSAQSIDRLAPLDDDDSSNGGLTTIPLTQTQRSAVVRYTYDPTARLHLTAATYYSNYSIFGTSWDPRFGLTFDPDARTVVRGSVGTTYQSPQLPELYVPPSLPPLVDGIISIGNPNLKPDRATEYGLGIEHVFDAGPQRTDVSLDLYRVNLRQPATPYVPPGNCGLASDGFDGTACPVAPCGAAAALANGDPLTCPINAGNGVYQGFELAGERRVAAYTTVRAGYAVRSAYLTAVPASVQDGTLAIGEQAQGLPLAKATLSVRRAPPLGFGFDAGLVYEGLYNELNQPQFAVLNAGVGYRWSQYEAGLNATNLTDVYDQRFTRQAAGETYGGEAGQPTITSPDYTLQGTAFTLTLSRRF